MLFKVKNISLLIALTVSLGLVSCDKKTITNAIETNKIECSDETGTTSVLSIISESAEKAIKEERNDISISEIRAVISSLKLGIKDVRTSKEDPNSTKVFCDAEVTLTTPINMIKEANEGLRVSGDNRSINLILEDYGLKPSKNAANTYESTITYNIQPTDDGTSIVSYIDDGNDQLVSSIKDIILWSKVKKDASRTKTYETSQNNQNTRIDTSTAVFSDDVSSVPSSDNFNSQPESNAKKAYLNCSIGDKVASEKCLVVEQTLVANTPDTVNYFGSNGSYRLITIMWPDKDVSEYAILDDSRLINLKKPKSGDYQLQDTVGSNLNLEYGFGITRNGNNYIRFW